jgi:hypothetical protein
VYWIVHFTPRDIHWGSFAKLVGITRITHVH